MNRNHIKALLLLGVIGSLATGAAGQANPLPFPPPNATPLKNRIDYPINPLFWDWVIICEDPTSTTSPYSTDYGIEEEYDSLFGAVMGVSGTVNYSKYCFGPGGVTLPMAGRLGFYIGTDPYLNLTNGNQNPNYGLGGSTQDTLAGSEIDDGLGLTFGAYTGVAGNFAIANIVQATTDATTGAVTTKMEYFGKAAIDTAYWGLSDRYFICESTTGLAIRVQARVDVIGDAARVQWTLTNQGTAAVSEGLWFGQWVYATGPQGQHSFDYVQAPGLKPLNSDTRFTLKPNVTATAPPELPLPAYLDYGMYQSWAYGLQIVLGPTAQIPDQTQADGIDVGKNGFLLGSMTASDGAMPDVLLTDTAMLNGTDAYVEKFNPTPVGAAGSGTETRVIVAYYRSTWSVSDYAKPYSVVLDAPPIIATTPGQPQTFQNAPFFLTVHIDDTRGFSQNDQSVPLQGVEVDLDLPPGMTDANNPTSNHMVQFLGVVPPQAVEHVTFQVAVDPTLFGNQQYTVTVIPNPGPTKVLTGTVTVASQPYLQLTGTANLVTAPWQFASSDWNTIIGANSGLVLDQDYQVFGWDPLAQDYVLQTDPQRGFGSFVVSNQNVGFVPLGGGPQQVNDLQTGAPQIILQPGWNLIANPYNYAIPVGELVGVPEADNQNAYTFAQLANLNYVNGSLAFWSPLTQAYGYLTNLTDLIQPNTGYWLYVSSNQPVTIEYPPVFQAYIPGLTDGVSNTPPKKVKDAAGSVGAPLWALQLTARSNGMIDSQTSIGQVANAQVVNRLTRFKAPVAPVKNAISSAIVVPNGKKTSLLAQALTTETVSSQTWDWQVFTQNTGVVTLAWPNISSVPNNVQVKLIDSNGNQHLLRNTNSFTFTGKAQSVQNFKLVVTTGPQLPVIESLTASQQKSAANVSYTLSVNANSTVTVMKGTQLVATLVNNRSDNSGTQTTSWNYLDSANRTVKPGVYQIVVSSTPTGGATATKSMSISVTR